MAVPQNAPAAGLTPADLWRIVRANWLIIALFTLLCTGAAYGAFVMCLRWYPSYTVTGLVACNRPADPISTRTVPIAPSGEVVGIDVDLRSNAKGMTAEDLWNTVITNSNALRDTEWFKQFMQAAQARPELDPAVLARQDLKEHFKASPATGTRLIVVNFDSKFPNDAKTVMEEIVQQYITRAQSNATDKLNAQVESLKKLIGTYKRQLDDARSQSASLSVQLNADGITGVAGKLSLKELEISALTGKKLDAEEERNQAKGIYESLQAAVKDGQELPQVENAVESNGTIAMYRSSIESMDMDLKTTIANLGPENATAKTLQGRLEYLKGRLSDKESEIRTMTRNSILTSAKQAYEASESKAKNYADRVENLRQEMATMSSDFGEFVAAKERQDGLQQVVRELNDRQTMLTNTINTRDSGVSWFSHPLPPDAPTFPDRKIFLAAGAAIGLLLSMGLAFAREVLDTSVRSPRDLQRVGPMNLLGMIPADSDDPESNGTPLHLAISSAPHSIIAEQFRQVRTRLQHAASLDTTRSIVVTSPAPGDGKSTIACNLAAGLALNGRRILLVDANFRRADLHRLFGVPNDIGFSNVLESIGNLESAVQKTTVPNLELLTTGPRPANPTELIESQLFSDFIDRALEEYDHVIFDAGPLLVVSEAVALAPRVDGVITVVRTKANSRGMLARVRDTLKQIKAEHLGVVLNRVETWGGGYYGRNIRTYYEYQSSNN